LISYGGHREEELRELFNKIDLNGNGLIEAHEIRIALDQIGARLSFLRRRRVS
jgi:Ca2+-binding EF-hand superfamily protein